MRTSLRLFTVAILAGFIQSRVQAQSIAPFKAGDRIAFVGNSITDGGHYHSYIWLYYMTHFPNMRITCINAGIGGDDVKQISDRFNEDVVPMHPNIVTVTWGMNDTGYLEWNWDNAAEWGKKKVETAKARYQVLDAKLKKLTTVKKITILGSPYDETTTSNKNNLYKGKSAGFAQLIDFQQQTAKTNGWGVVDFFHPMTEINLREQAKDPAFSLTPNDRVHPDNNGHLVMAYQFLKTQGLANKAVADVAINAASKLVSKSTNCLVKNVMGTTNNISFDYLANSLPYPIDTIPRAWGNKVPQSEALKLIPFMEEFNKEQLTISGLKSGNYNLIIDKEVVGRYTSDQLASGVNLAENAHTPQYQQAIAVRELNEERWEIERRFRNYAFVEFNLLKSKGLLYADNRAAMDSVTKEAKKNPFIGGNRDNYMKAQFKPVRDAWQQEMDVLVNQIYANNKPKNHHITLQLVK